MSEIFEYRPQTGDPNREEILEGNGWEEIERVGWEAYRQELVNVPYSQIMERQLGPIRDLRQRPLPPHTSEMSPNSILVRNSEAKLRAFELSQTMVKDHGADTPGSFTAFRGGDKKLFARGRSLKMSDRPVRRFYFSVLTRKAPEAFQSLVESLEQEGVMEHSDVALNLETYQDELKKTFENNTLILYMYGDHPEQLTKVARAVRRAKEQGNPDAWKMGPKDEARARESMLKDFIVPLDGTSGFVEMSSLQSYHAGDRGHMYEEITRGPVSQRISAEKLQQEMQTWTPEKPGIFADQFLKHRRKYMPGLVFEKPQPSNP